MQLVTLWAPFEVIEKSGDDSSGRGRIRGIASSEAIDADNEIILQKGLDFTNAKWITLEHPCGVTNIVGEPIDFKLVKAGEHLATEIEADLFLTDALGKQIFEKAKTLSKAQAKSKLGFSIEGRAVKRDGNKIEEAVVHSVAISANPKNPMAMFDPVMASMFWRAATAGYPQQGVAYQSNFAPIVPQSLDSAGESSTPMTEEKELADEAELKREAERRVEALSYATYSANGGIDALTTALLKKAPNLNWYQGEKIIRGIVDRVYGRTK